MKLKTKQIINNIKLWKHSLRYENGNGNMKINIIYENK